MMEAIFVMVDQLSKYGHFIPLRKITKVFIKKIGRLNGVPQSFVSGQDPLFISVFWKELFRLQGTLLKMSSHYYRETDSQTEVVNRALRPNP